MTKTETNQASLARRAIEYLVTHDFMLRWNFDDADPPPEEIRHLLASYFDDGEIEVTTSELLSNFLLSRLREDHLPMDDQSRLGRNRVPSSRSSACRVVGGNDDD